MSSTDALLSPASADAAAGETAPEGEQDLAALALLIDGLRESLEAVAGELARCARASDDPAARDMPAVQQALRQTGDLLESVRMPAPARLVQAMQAAVLRLEQDARHCTPEAARLLENASIALLEYLDTLLAGGPASAVALFPQYRAVQALAGNDKVHPADLWHGEQHLREPALPECPQALACGPQARALLDAGVLALVRTGDAAAAARLRAICLGFVAAQTDSGARTFWKIAAGFFEALAQGLVKPDVYAKRAASRVLMQYAAMAKGDNRLPERLTQDLLFFCAQAAEPAGDAQAPVLSAVRETFGLARHPSVDYDLPRFGLSDPEPVAEHASLEAPLHAPLHAPQSTPMDDNVKVIDGLCIHLPLYNAYLNDADEWSRCLEVALQEWALEAHRPQPAQAVDWAHSLAASSATVGFEDLSRLSRTLAQALLHVRPQGAGDARQLAVFEAAAQEIRRLLHQFAAGFLKPPLASVETALQQVLDGEVRGAGSAAPEPGPLPAFAPDPEAVVSYAAAASDALPPLSGQRLDRLIDQSGEVLSARARIDARLVEARAALHGLDACLGRLRQQLRDIEVQAEALGLSEASAAGPGPQESDGCTRMRQLTRMMAESVDEVAAVQRNLQRDLTAAEDDLLALGRQARDLQRDLLSARGV